MHISIKIRLILVNEDEPIIYIFYFCKKRSFQTGLFYFATTALVCVGGSTFTNSGITASMSFGISAAIFMLTLYAFYVKMACWDSSTKESMCSIQSKSENPRISIRSFQNWRKLPWQFRLLRGVLIACQNGERFC